MQSKAKTVEQYLKELPEDRRKAISAIRSVILKNLDSGFEEGMQYGMIGYAVPHRIYPPGYHCDPSQPLIFAALASQKNYISVYLMCVYGDDGEKERFQQAWSKTGKKLDMGKSCIRFRNVEDAALDVIGDSIKRVTAAAYIAKVEQSLASRSPRAKTSQNARPATKKTANAKRKTTQSLRPDSNAAASRKRTQKKAAKKK